MGETDYHLIALIYLYNALHDWFRLQDDVYVAGDMLLYYEEGNPKARRGPDVMVAKGVVGKHKRRSFRVWEEGVPPTVIIEVTSKKTRDEDEKEKPPVYASIGVKELFLFDPEGDWLRPRLRGFRLTGGTYAPMAVDDAGRLFSPELGLRLAIDDHLLRLIDPSTENPLPTSDELAEQARLARREAKYAKRKESAAKRRVAELEAEVARLRAKLPPHRQR